MNSVNKTLYIPLYGKALVSEKGIILSDRKAEAIWRRNAFPLKRKSRSKYLAYFMAMRAKVFDNWTKRALREEPFAAVLHIGCGLDGRIERTDCFRNNWYDIDLPEVIAERRKYYQERAGYKMLEGNAAQPDFLADIRGETAVVILEGVSMYLSPRELEGLFCALCSRFREVRILMDVYTPFGAKMSAFANPINDVGVSKVFAVESPTAPAKSCGLKFVKERTMTPKALINQLEDSDRAVFGTIFAGDFARKLYRLYEYRT